MSNKWIVGLALSVVRLFGGLVWNGGWKEWNMYACAGRWVEDVWVWVDVRV